MVTNSNSHHRADRSAIFLELMRTVATAANEASTIEQAMQVSVDAVCSLLDWPIGHLWLCPKGNPHELYSTEVWKLDGDERLQAFWRETNAVRFVSGVGLPGLVLQSRKPAWIPDVTKDRTFLRAVLAKAAGIKAALAFPVIARAEVVGVLEFFSMEAEEPDGPLLDVMADVGIQLGLMVERKRAEADLRDSEMRFRSVAQSAIDAIISSDDGGRICSWNRGAEIIFGYTEHEIIDKPLTILMPQRYREAHQRGLERVNSTGEARVIGKVVELYGLRKDGSEFPLELSLGTWTTEEGAFYAGIIRDITERKRAEEEIKRLNEELERRVIARTAQLEALNEQLKREIEERKRLEAQKDEFIAVASHELRTPMTVVKGYTKLSLRTATELGDARLIANLRKVNEKVDQITQLITEMLDVSRIQRGRLPITPQVIDLVNLVRNVARNYADIAGVSATYSGEITLDLPTQPVLVNADPQRIEQVLTNLLDNALRYTSLSPGEDGKIEIAVKPSSGNNLAIISVRDHGIGIPAQQQDQVFDLFFRGSNVRSANYPYPGLGLGLFICSNIVGAHKGRMWVESAEGKGSTFYFSLPLLYKS